MDFETSQITSWETITLSFAARIVAVFQDTLISGLLKRDLNPAFNHVRGLKDIVECRRVLAHMMLFAFVVLLPR